MNHDVSRRSFLLTGAALAVQGLPFSRAQARAIEPDRPPNVLLFTADDMNWDTPGCFGGNPADVTLNLDRLAAEGMRFLHAHVTVAVCMPSRETLLTGRYPHRHGGMGFEPIREDVPTLIERLDDAGYLTGILGKALHVKPDSKFMWEMMVDFHELGAGRNPARYAQYARAHFDTARRRGQPFFLMVNSHDPHRPFSGSEAEANALDRSWTKRGVGREDVTPPSRTYPQNGAYVPGMLPDLAEVRREIGEYLTSARRCDDTLGAVLQALEASEQAENTLVMFLSDNGMAFPFAKTTCYLNGTRTPWIVRWPGRVSPGTVDIRHMISGIDFMPTVLDAAGLSAPAGMDGRSFLPVLEGRRQAGRDRVFTVFHENSAGERSETRCVQDGRFGYIFNAWSDGERRFRNNGMSGLTWRAMERAGEHDAAIAARTRLFLYRVPEELYDFQTDPDALHNLAGNPDFRRTLCHARRMLRRWMRRTQDFLLPEYESMLRATG